MSIEKTTAIKDLIADPLSRRAFAHRAVTTGLMAAVGAGIAGFPETADAQSLTDVDILNFALNLEYLEAEFYTVATTGKRISDIGIGVTGVGTAGATTGGSQVSLDNTLANVALNLANEEQMHVSSSCGQR